MKEHMDTPSATEERRSQKVNAPRPRKGGSVTLPFCPLGFVARRSKTPVFSLFAPGPTATGTGNGNLSYFSDRLLFSVFGDKETAGRRNDSQLQREGIK